MKAIRYIIPIVVFAGLLLAGTSCEEDLHEPLENQVISEKTNYKNTDKMSSPLVGLYGELYGLGWDVYPIISIRGDDVNKGGEGFNQVLGQLEQFDYDENFWMINTVWQQMYQGIFEANTTIEEIGKYKKYADNKALADQYIAEAQTIRAWYYFHLTRLWGKIFLTDASDPTTLFEAELSSKQEVLQYISDQMGEAAPNMADLHPKQRTDLQGGVTKYTALALKAKADLEMGDYQSVADATSQIINSGVFSLEDDFYQLFKLDGKLNNENIFELQYSDFGQGSGENRSYLFAFFGPQNWTPAVSGANSGWGFWEPTLEYIRFMLDRGEHTRLQTSVLFTPDGISELQDEYGDLPSWISNETPSGDIIENGPRANFFSGKHYLPSVQLTPGRTNYGTNKNMQIIRYAEILLIHAEALVQGASSSALSADQAVNLVRDRAGISSLSNVTLEQVMAEKYAELSMEWGIRFYDMVRLGNYQELNYHGAEPAFTEDKLFLPYPLKQVDLLPQLENE